MNLLPRTTVMEMLQRSALMMVLTITAQPDAADCESPMMETRVGHQQMLTAPLVVQQMMRMVGSPSDQVLSTLHARASMNEMA